MSFATEINRREVMRGIAALSLSPLAASIARAADDPTVTDVAPGIKVIGGGGGNVVAFSTTVGLVLVDSGSREAQEETLAKIAKIAKEDENRGRGREGRRARQYALASGSDGRQ